MKTCVSHSVIAEISATSNFLLQHTWTNLKPSKISNVLPNGRSACQISRIV